MTDEAEIYRRMRLFGYSLANRMLPEQERDDAVQSAMLAVCKAIPKLRAGTSWEPFMVRVVRQEMAMFARAFYAQRENTSLRGLGDTLPDAHPALVHGQAHTLSDRLRAVLDTLPERQREALVECVGEGRNPTLAGEVMGISSSAVSQYVRRGIRNALTEGRHLRMPRTGKCLECSRTDIAGLGLCRMHWKRQQRARLAAA